MTMNQLDALLWAVDRIMEVSMNNLCRGCRITRNDFLSPNAVCNHEGATERITDRIMEASDDDISESGEICDSVVTTGAPVSSGRSGDSGGETSPQEP